MPSSGPHVHFIANCSVCQ